MKLLFDIQRSLTINPPIYGKGIKHLERIPVTLKDLVIETPEGVTLNPRFKDCEEQSHQELITSFTTQGVLYEKQVMVVELRKDGKYELQSGFNRIYIFMKYLGITTYFVDVIEYDNNYWKALWKRRFNASEDHVGVGVPNTEASFIKGLSEARQFKSFEWQDDDVVLDALDFMARGTKTDKQLRSLLKKFRETNHSDDSVKGLNTSMANELAEEMGLPYKGYCKDASKSYYGRIGYSVYSGDFATNIKKYVDFYDQWNTFDEEDNVVEPAVPIELYGFLQHIVVKKLENQRKVFVDDFDKTVKWMKNHLAPKYHNIIQFRGFHAQLATQDPNNGGEALERGIVNKHGNILIDNR